MMCVGVAQKRALDIGCAVGGMSFELARTCGEVVGLDQSAAVVTAANSMRTQGKMELFRSVRAASLQEITPHHLHARADQQRACGGKAAHQGRGALRLRTLRNSIVASSETKAYT
jgi:SAM-dependent methyltransferase